MKDRVLSALINKEIDRQQKTINLIASENFVSPDILKVVGSPLMNKYSEGYAGKRYYPGNRFYDEIEKLTQKRGLKVFKLENRNWSANVQPYSGSPANLAIYSALLLDHKTKNRKSKTDVLGMSLTSGGHLTHGHKVNFSGIAYKAIQYDVDKKTGLINYQEIERLAKKWRPKIIVSGASAYPREINFKKFGAIAKKIKAYHLADISHIAGLVAAGLHPSPFPYSDVVMTTTHKTLRGPRAAVIFSRKSISEAIDKMVFPGMQGGPHNNTIAAIAEMFFEALRPEFKEYQKQVLKNAQALAASLKDLGFNLITNGTDNHLILIKLKSYEAKPRKIKIGGFMAEKKLEKAGILVNRNSVPGDTNPFRPSGLRLGTPAITTRGMKEKEMRQIAEWIYRILVKNESFDKIRKEVEALCRKFPLFYKN